jgi:glucoamylase
VGEYPTRRAVLLGAGALGVGTLGAVRVLDRGYPRVALLGETVAFDGTGGRRLIAAAELPALGPSSRCLTTAPARVRAAERDFLAALPAWTRTGPHQSLLESALLDLWVLGEDLPAPVAGWAPKWRYIWPRDAAHVAAAHAALGDIDRALAPLAFLAARQESSGWFEPRYDPWTGRAPDGRAHQLDATAWVLWAAGRLVALAPGEADRIEAVTGPMVRRSAGLLAHLLATQDLPPATPDYWEVSTPVLTLGTAASVLAGVRAAYGLGRVWGDAALADRSGAAAERLRVALSRTFEPAGWPREIDGRAVDAAVAFLAPPYAADPPPASVGAALDRYRRTAARPAGGLAPGADWKRDGISWTPETLILAQAYAHLGRAQDAGALLDWVAAHRTRAGSIPEKVLYDGTPAAVAPLAWSAALAVTTIARLRGV